MSPDPEARPKDDDPADAETGAAITDAEDSGTDPERRRFLTRAAMTAGLAGGYGAFGAIAARYLYPADPDAREWQFLMPVNRLDPGESVLYRSPAGETINVTRQGDAGDASDFIALSSTCPHLGCQVHWEPHNDRYFCPCHNGVFDPAGNATAGPPAEANQDLPRYELRVEENRVYILVDTRRLVERESRIAVTDAGELIEEPDCISAAGHDPCLAGGRIRSRRASRGDELAADTASDDPTDEAGKRA